jgi:hypothetical protein
MDAKVAAGYFSAEAAVSSEELTVAKGRGLSE